MIADLRQKETTTQRVDKLPVAVFPNGKSRHGLFHRIAGCPVDYEKKLTLGLCGIIVNFNKPKFHSIGKVAAYYLSFINHVSLLIIYFLNVDSLQGENEDTKSEETCILEILSHLYFCFYKPTSVCSSHNN